MKTIKKRRKENKTNYSKRLKLLKSSMPRIIFRKTNKYLISQYVVSKEAQDYIKAGINSKKLLNYGWPKKLEHSLKSLPAAYLLGFAIGKKIIKQKLEQPIIDFGMHRNLHKTKLYAFMKGLIDAGIKIKNKKDIFPDEKRIKGKHEKDIPFQQIKSKIENEK